MYADRVLYCVSGAWTDAWYDEPGAWWQWCCAFRGWAPEQWSAFIGRWRTAPQTVRERLMAENGLRFFDWSRVPGGSIRGKTSVAAGLIGDDLARFPAGTDVTIIGHSKGGHAVKLVLAAGHSRPTRAVLVDAPLDWLRETAGRLLGLGLERCVLTEGESRVPCVTINNWLDPSGGRLRGRPNYQTLVWQDYLNPYPPHGMKGFLAERVLRDVGAIPALPAAGDDPGAQTAQTAQAAQAAQTAQTAQAAQAAQAAQTAQTAPAGVVAVVTAVPGTEVVQEQVLTERDWSQPPPE